MSSAPEPAHVPTDQNVPAGPVPGPADGHASTDGRAGNGMHLADIAAEDPVREVLAGIRDLAHSVDRYRHALGVQHGIGVPEVVTLAHLAATGDGGVRASEIAERTGLTQASVTALLDRLERRGFTHRVRPAHNRRIVLVELTETGRDLALGMYAPVLPMLATAAGEPDAPDPSRMAHCLRRIAAMMGHLADHPDARTTS